MNLRGYYNKHKFLFKRINIFEFDDLIQEYNLRKFLLHKRLNVSLFIKSLLQKCHAQKRSITEIDIDELPTKQRDYLLNEYYSIWGYDSSYE